jgi:UDP-N-acetylglucosamine acyltransferase
MPIHPSSLINPAARVHPDAEIGPFCIVEAGVEVSAGCRLLGHVVLRTGTFLAEGVVVHPGAVIGGEPQDLKFKPETVSGVRVGARTVLREGVTLHRATKEGTDTCVGQDCFLMVGSHVGHDTVVGNNVVMVNGVALAGHVIVEDNVVLGGGAMMHQFCRIGDGSMIGGAAAMSKDVPPFCLAAERNRLVGLNLIGLRRRGFSRDDIFSLKTAFHLVFSPGSNPRSVATERLASGVVTNARERQFLEFVCGGRKPIMRPRQAGSTEETE